MSNADLIAKLRGSTEADNALDIAVDIALFKPDEDFVSVRPNDAFTKLVYTCRDGGTKTYWANDWTLNKSFRTAAIDRLSTLPNTQKEGT